MPLFAQKPTRTIAVWIVGVTISWVLLPAPLAAQPIIVAAPSPPPTSAASVPIDAPETTTPALLSGAEVPGTLHLRATWGGGRSALWRGRIAIRGGTLLASRTLSLEADAPVAQRLEAGALLIEPMVPRSFDGVDLTIQASADAELLIELADEAGKPSEPRAIPIRDLFVGPQGWLLEEGEERFVIERAPGDDVRVSFQRDHLVFEPREVFEFTVTPGPIVAVDELAGLVAEVKVLRARTEELVDSTRGLPIGSSTDSNGSSRFRLTMPDAPGPYSLRIELVTRRGVSPFLRTRTLLSRTIDVVVVGSDARPRSSDSITLDGVPGLAAIGAQLPAPLRILPGARDDSESSWNLLHEIDPQNPGWIERLKQLDAVHLVKRFSTEPLGTGDVTIEDSAAGPVLRLPPGAWRAFPLPVDRRGAPHRLELEYLEADLSSAAPHRAAIAFVEPDSLAWTNSAPVGVGLELRRPSGVVPPRPDQTSLVSLYHWPTTRAPWVVITNLSDTQELRVRRLRWLGGPMQLESIAEAPASAAASFGDSSNGDSTPRRFLGPHLTPETLADYGMSERLVEHDQGLPIEDWKYYDDAITRLIERMQASGMNAITLQVAGYGSGWYPSSQMRFGPRYDRGVFSIEGRDPISKDVVELFLARFTAANLSVIPVFDFDAPFPEIEARRRTGEGREVDQVDERGESRRLKAIEFRDPRGYHDPLHPEVAAAMMRRVDEFIERYGDHTSLAGIGLRLGPGSHLFFGEPGWGASPTRIREFLQSMDSGVSEGPQETASLLRGETREAWLAWRGSALADLFGEIERRACSPDGKRRLFLLGEDWYQGTSITRRTQVVPRGRDPDPSVMALEAGISFDAIEQSTRAVLLHSNTLRFDDPTGLRRVERALGAKPLLTPDGKSLRVGMMTHRPSSEIEVEALGQLVTGKSSQPLERLRPRTLSAGELARKREAEAMAAGDCWALLDEGLGLPLVEDEKVLDFRQVFSQLPQVPFEQEATEMLAEASVPVVLRRGSGEADDLRYLVNPSPWPVKVEMSIRESDSEQVISPLGDSKVFVRRSGPGTTLAIELDPYGLAAFRVQDRTTSVSKIEVVMTEDVAETLQSELDRWLAAVNELGIARAEILPLANHGFEQTEPTDQPKDWLRSRSGVSAPKIEGASEGSRVARLASDEGIVWMRSSELPPPQSGRLSLQVRVRNRQTDRQPNLRLAIEAVTPSGPYYQFAPIGDPERGGTGREIGSDWTPFAVHFDDLPPDQVSELRVGFDLMNGGDVEIDQVVVLDGWLDDADQKVLFQRISVARMRLQEGGIFAPYELLESFWPRNILETWEEASEPLELPESAEATPAGQEPVQQSRNPWDRVRQMVPATNLLR